MTRKTDGVFFIADLMKCSPTPDLTKEIDAGWPGWEELERRAGWASWRRAEPGEGIGYVPVDGPVDPTIFASHKMSGLPLGFMSEEAADRFGRAVMDLSSTFIYAPDRIDWAWHCYELDALATELPADWIKMFLGAVILG